jgi:hypothetical protein
LKTQASRGIVFFYCLLGPLCKYATCLEFRAYYLYLYLEDKAAAVAAAYQDFSLN